MKGGELFARCLENEGVDYIFGLPGEENIDLLDALNESPIRFVTDPARAGRGLHGRRLRPADGRAGVCLSTLGPGATNLVTGVADANMDRAPVVAIAGQGATTRMHKESHQILDRCCHVNFWPSAQAPRASFRRYLPLLSRRRMPPVDDSGL